MDELPDKLYKALVECSTDIVSIMRDDGVILYESPAIEQLLGYQQGELIQKNILTYVHPVDLPGVISMIAEGKLHKDKSYTARIRFRHKDGTWKWIESYAKFLPDDAQVAGGIVVQTRLVVDAASIDKENTQAELQLRKFQHIIEQSPSSIVLTDKNGNIEYVNPTFTLMTGYTLEETIGKNPRILKSGKVEQGTYEDLWKNISNNQTWRGELCNKKKNGELYWEYATISPIVDSNGSIINYAAIKNNITDRKKIEQQLAQQGAYLGNIINVAADPIFVKDRQHNWVLLNDSMCSFMGRKREELIGKSDYDFFPKEEADMFWSKDEEVFTREKENTNEEYFTDAKGIRHTIITKKTIYISDKGEKYIVGIIRDITEQKRIETELQKRAQETERMNALMIGRELKMIELKKQIAQLQEKIAG